LRWRTPPLLIVSDMGRFRVHTNWTNTVQHVHDLSLDDLADASKRQILRDAFLDPDRLKPSKTRQGLTEEAVQRFAALALRLRSRGHDAATVALFVNRLYLFAPLGLAMLKVHPVESGFAEAMRRDYEAGHIGNDAGVCLLLARAFRWRRNGAS
jgi:hypothetical protein